MAFPKTRIYFYETGKIRVQEDYLKYKGKDSGEVKNRYTESI